MYEGEIVAINAIPPGAQDGVDEGTQTVNVREELQSGVPNLFSIFVRENAAGTDWDIYNGSYCSEDQDGERLTFDKVYNAMSRFVSEPGNETKILILAISKAPFSASGNHNFCDGVETTNDNFDAIFDRIEKDSINYPLFNLNAVPGGIRANYTPNETLELNIHQQNVYSVWFLAEDCAGYGDGEETCNDCGILAGCLSRDEATLPAKERLVLEYID